MCIVNYKAHCFHKVYQTHLSVNRGVDCLCQKRIYFVFLNGCTSFQIKLLQSHSVGFAFRKNTLSAYFVLQDLNRNDFIVMLHSYRGSRSEKSRSYSYNISFALFSLRAESIPTIGIYLYRGSLFCNTMKEKIYIYYFLFYFFLVFCYTPSTCPIYLLLESCFFFSAMPPNNNQLIV